MRSLFRHAVRKLGDERGFTLTEVLMASVLGLFVVGIATTVFVTAVRTQPGLTTRGDAIRQARTGMERLVRELRQGNGTVYGQPAANQLSFLTYVPGSTCGATSNGFCRVTYSCATSGTCTRTVAKADGTSPSAAANVVTGLKTSNVFSYLPTNTAPYYITATFVFPGQNGGEAITVSDGAALRNRTTS
jgi:prepilin-type N-terminal cleavage/methylation domain-containing protein